MISIQTRNNGIICATLGQLLTEYQKSRKLGLLTERSKKTYLRLIAQARNQLRINAPIFDTTDEGEEFFTRISKRWCAKINGEVETESEQYENCAGQSLGSHYKACKTHLVATTQMVAYDSDNAAYSDTCDGTANFNDFVDFSENEDFEKEGEEETAA